MSRTARLWKGAGALALGGALLSSSATRGDDQPPLADQLTDLGRQALAQGAGGMARSFFQKALQLDPSNAGAAKGLGEAKAAEDRLVRRTLQEAETPAPPAPGEAGQTPPAPPAASHTVRPAPSGPR